MDRHASSWLIRWRSAVHLSLQGGLMCRVTGDAVVVVVLLVEVCFPKWASWDQPASSFGLIGRCLTAPNSASIRLVRTRSLPPDCIDRQPPRIQRMHLVSQPRGPLPLGKLPAKPVPQGQVLFRSATRPASGPASSLTRIHSHDGQDRNAAHLRVQSLTSGKDTGCQ